MVKRSYVLMQNKKAMINKKILKSQEVGKIRLVIEGCPAKAIKYM